MTASLELNRRQDLINVLFGNFLWREKDRVVYELPISSSTQNPIVFAFMLNSLLKNNRTKFEDLKTLTHVVKGPEIYGYSVLAENNDAAEYILNPQVQSLIKKLTPTVEMIYISDQTGGIANYPIYMKCEFLLPNNNEDIIKQIELVLLLSDLVNTLKLSAHARAACDKERAAIEKERQKEIQAQREEERQKKKLDQKKKEEEKKQNLSKEKLRRVEEKQYKQDLKKKTMKFKTVKA